MKLHKRVPRRTSWPVRVAFGLALGACWIIALSGWAITFGSIAVSTRQTLELRLECCLPWLSVPPIVQSLPSETENTIAAKVAALPIAPPARPFAPASFRMALRPIVTGLASPVLVTHAGDGSNRLFVVEKAGIIRTIVGNRLLPDPFLDLRLWVRNTNLEEGMTGLAFHPDFQHNRRFFVVHSARDATQVLAEYRADATGQRGDLTSRKTLLVVPHENAQHFAGMVAFGPEGLLYLSAGDGSDGGSPVPTAQDLQSLRGKLLRIDVDRGDPYEIPPDNPFVHRQDARKEIWAYGLRNPWRFSFDRLTGDLWIGDVGEGGWEEINRVPSGIGGGQNFGYNTMEGSHCFQPAVGCDMAGLTLPVAEYSHRDGCAIIGGYPYRGTAFPMLAGAYYHSDYCSSHIWAVYQDASGAWLRTDLFDALAQTSSFGEDEGGELFLTGLSNGAVYQLTAEGVTAETR